MVRILVVDDEPIAIKSIFHIIKNDIDQSIAVEKARNGREAIELAWKFRPDIVVTDIKMPGLSGLDVIKELKTQLKNIRFIIISAYEQFTFAKEAVALGVDDYLLKPVSRTRMAESIKKCIDLVENEHAKMKRDLEMKERMEKMRPTIESGFLLSVLFFDDYDHLKTGKDLLELKNESGCVLVAEQRSLLPGYDSGKTFTEKCSNILKQYEGCLVCQLATGKIASFIPASDTEAGRQKAKDIAGELIAANKDKNVFWAVGIGNIYKNFKELKNSYGEARVALNSVKSGPGGGAVLCVKDLHGEALTDQDASEKKKNIVAKLNMGDLQNAINDLECLFGLYKKAFGDDFTRLKEKMAEVMAMLAVKVYDADMPENEDTIAPLLQTTGQRELLELCKTKLMELSVFNKSKISEIVNKVNEIIRKNYANDITLESTAKLIGISPAYLSRLYKQQTGYNFIDYLIKIRVDHAKRLFRSTDLSVKEISYRTGYIDPNYFSRLFKKTTGVTPTEFKRNCDSYAAVTESAIGGI